jgi:hypothetical protein
MLSSPAAFSEQIRLLSVVILTFLVFLPALNRGFINDELQSVDFVLTGDKPDFGKLFSREGVTGEYYRPLANATIAIDFYLWGWNASGYQLTNVLLHLLCVALVYQLGKRLFESESVALYGAAFFGVIPIHEVSILWILGRGDILCAIFYLVSLLALLRYLENKRFGILAVSWLFFLLALLAKEMALSLPIVAVLLAWWKGGDKSFRWESVRPFTVGVPYFAIALFVVALRWLALENNFLFAPQGPHATIDSLHIIKNIATYLGLLVIPFGHSQIEHALSRYPSLFILLSILCLVATGFIGWKKGRDYPELILLLLWVLVTLLPVSRLMMRWYLYIPSVGFCLGLGWFLVNVGTMKVKPAFVVGMSLWVLYAGILMGRSIEWADASRLADRMFAGLLEQIEVCGPRDTLTFVTIPAKVGTTPLFQLGLEHRLRHYLTQDSLTVEIWSRTVMEHYPASIRWEMADDGICVKATQGTFFQVESEDFMARRALARPGQIVKTEGLTVTILGVDSNNKPHEILCVPVRVVDTKLFSFDGERFIRLK